VGRALEERNIRSRFLPSSEGRVFSCNLHLAERSSLTSIKGLPSTCLRRLTPQTLKPTTASRARRLTGYQIQICRPFLISTRTTRIRIQKLCNRASRSRTWKSSLRHKERKKHLLKIFNRREMPLLVFLTKLLPSLLAPLCHSLRNPWSNHRQEPTLGEAKANQSCWLSWSRRQRYDWATDSKLRSEG
jgi:hypothetical protein